MAKSADRTGALVSGELVSGELVSFGPFALSIPGRLLTRDGAQVDIGGRTLDTLIALVSRPNEVIGKRELMAAVWPDTIVEEVSLRFHIAALRKVLGDGRDGARYIATLAGRGYCFVAPVARAEGGDRHAAPRGNLPGRLARMVGRDEVVDALAAEVTASRFVTLVGAGGVGKTTVAIAVGHRLGEAFRDAVAFVDFGVLAAPDLVAPTVASVLGLSPRLDNAADELAAFLRDRRMLLILDTCEHLIGSVADLTSRIMPVAPGLHILATSREALRVEGEHVHRLASLECPPEHPEPTALEIRRYPAAELFLERATAGGMPLDPGDTDAALVAGICRRLDGVALAIELVAGRVEAHGLEQIAALLDRHFSLLLPGQRTAPPRQQTLQATLDWSYALLAPSERMVLRRLAVFVGDFTLDGALQVAATSTDDHGLVFGAVDSLVAKSMLATRPSGAMMRYRLLDATRAYALAQPVDAAERAGLAARHATYYRLWLDETGLQWPRPSVPAERSGQVAILGNARAALDWCFGPGGDPATGVALAAAAAPAFLAMSLLTEYRRWAEEALRALGEDRRGSHTEMVLQGALGVSLMFTRGEGEAARLALERSLAIAVECGDARDQLHLLGPMQFLCFRSGAFHRALHHARRCSAIAARLNDPAATALAHAMMGIALHLQGDLRRAQAELTAVPLDDPQAPQAPTLLGFEKGVTATFLARTLWLRGDPRRAAEQALRAVVEAESTGHPLSLSITLMWSATVFLWSGDLSTAATQVDRLVACAGGHGLSGHLAVGNGMRGELAIRQGDAAGGVALLRESLKAVQLAEYELHRTPLSIALAQGLCLAGQPAEALALVDGTVALVEANGDHVYRAELLRMRGQIRLAMGGARDGEPEESFLAALDAARAQGARAWELRAAVDLATFWTDRGQGERSLALLLPVVEGFAEGFDTADLAAARQQLARPGSTVPAV